MEVFAKGDRILVSTNAGRLMALGSSDGKIIWQIRQTDRAIDRIVANDDFVVLRIRNEASVQLIALDSQTGKTLGSKIFDTANNSFPVNLALSSDGTLVYTLPDRICFKDLDAGGENILDPKFESHPLTQVQGSDLMPPPSPISFWSGRGGHLPSARARATI